MPTSLVCERCGHENRDEARFCARCETRRHVNTDRLEGPNSGPTGREPTATHRGICGPCPPDVVATVPFLSEVWGPSTAYARGMRTAPLSQRSYTGAPATVFGYSPVTGRVQ